MERFCLKQINNIDGYAPIVICLNSDLLKIGKGTFPSLKKIRYLRPQHARVTKKNNDWFIKNLTRNVGTYVNSRRITKKQKLKIGDIIGFGVSNVTSKGLVCIFCLTDNEIMHEPVYIVNEENHQPCYDLSTSNSSVSKSADLSNKLSILKPSTKVDDNVLENVKKCYVKLIRCDSKYFKLPPDVKSISEPHKRAFSNPSQRRYAEQHERTFFGANASLLPQVNSELHVDVNSNIPCDSFQIDSSCVQRHNSYSHSHCKPQNSVTAVVKPLRETQGRRNQGVKNHIGYSQTEEVICISDDDSHLDFNSSLPIKSEVLYDSDYLDFSLLNELPDENDIQLIYDTNDDKETIENINHFILSHENVHVKKEKGDHSYSDLDCPTDIFSADKSDKEFLSGNVSDDSNDSLPSVKSVSNNKYTLSDKEIKSNNVFDNARKNNIAIDSISDYESGDSDVSLHSIIMYPSSYNKSSEKSEAKDSKKPKYLIKSDDDENGVQESDDSDISLHSNFVYSSPYNKSSEKKDVKHFEKPKYVIKSRVDENVSVKKSKLVSRTVKESKLVSRTMLTEPKPMIPRPKRLRGREEVFIPVEDEELVEKHRDTEPSKKHMTTKSSVKSFQKKCASKSCNLNEIRKGKSSATIEVGEAQKLKNLSSNSVAKHTLPTVKVRPEHFSSRSKFLTTSLINNDTHKPRSSIKRISESNVKTEASKKAKQTNSDVPVVNYTAKKSDQSQDMKNSFSFNNNLISDTISITSGVEGGLNRKLLSKNSNQPPTSKDNSDKKSKDNKTKKFFNNNTSLVSDSSISINSHQSPTSKGKEISGKKSKDSQTKTYIKDNTSFVSELKTSTNRNNNLSHNNLSSNSPNTSTAKTRTVLHSINTDSKLKKDISKQVIDTSTQFKQVKDFSYNNEDKKPTAVVAGTSYPNSQTYSANKIIEKIVGLNVQWINEQKSKKLPPPFVYKDSEDLPLSFDSYEHYVSAFQPMLMLEIWEEICKFAQPVLDSEFKCQKFYFTIYKSHKKNSLIIYDCEALINQNSPEPTEGNLVILAIKNLDGNVHVIFGYISKHQVITNFLSKHISPKWDQVTSNWISGAKLYKFSVVTKLNLLSPKCYDIMRGNVILSVKKKFHLALALEKFKASPLRDNILKPDGSAFTVSNHITSNCYEMRFNASQTQVIDSLGEELERENQEQKIFLLQGPPGTGKTLAIIGLLERLIFSPSYSGKKILITAPSSVAVDEIGLRIVDFNERLSYKRVEIKFVRIGQGKDMNVKMKDYSLEIQADDAVRNNHVKDRNGQGTVQNKLHSEKVQILKRCHVILSTLRNCWHPAICSKEIQIAACIVDEATQCTEIEILQPLTLNIHKLLLVGDHNQLPPTVHSQIAVQKHFDRSMLERIYLYLSKTVSPNPPYMLKEQFRMHSSICEFPSRYFYGGQLITEFCKNQDFSISPYVVFDVSSCNDDNCDEAVAIAKLCEFVSTKESYSSIGVIVPHKKQIDIFQNFLSKIRGHKNIEVNMVDNFQGREKDIIIISCLSPNYLAESIDFLSCKKRLNVAITRARHCLLLVANSSMLSYFDHWDALFSDAKQRNLFVKINELKNFMNMFDFLHERH
nr:uncharacterized ATP-dependent helicase C29A10.10c-like [Parasteatoda tepidariorum]